MSRPRFEIIQETVNGQPIRELLITDTRHHPELDTEAEILVGVPGHLETAEWIAELGALADSVILEEFFGRGCN
ncbi:MAG TPA: hypothetical protein VNU68_07250 [Verrucomicrobiae bacterium]|nr:hypothetical protein [Verrucomicrobiae bacterium]